MPTSILATVEHYSLLDSSAPDAVSSCTPQVVCRGSYPSMELHVKNGVVSRNGGSASEAQYST